MAEHREKYTIFGPFPDADPLDTALLFLRTNRYRLLTRTDGEPPEDLQVDPSIAPYFQPESDEPPEDEPERADSDADDSDPDDEAEAADSENVPESADSDADDDASADVDVDDGAETDEPEDSKSDEAAESAPTSDEESGEICLTAELERGEKWSSFLSSNMADLPTNITLQLQGNVVRVDYVVETTGQFLTDSDREFWKQEAQALEKFMKGAGELFSLASLEGERASTARRERMGSALWIAAVVFVVIFMAGVMLTRM